MYDTSREYPFSRLHKGINSFVDDMMANEKKFRGKKFFLGGANRNSKIGLLYDIRHIPISLHAKFQGNRTIRLGEKR